MLRFDDPKTYELLLDVCAHYGVDPSNSLEAEKYFTNLLAQYTGNVDPESVITWLEERVARLFVAIGERPHWIQGLDWPIVDEEPTIFVGQIDISVSDGGIASELYHDDTSFYIFVQRRGSPIVVMQQF